MDPFLVKFVFFFFLFFPFLIFRSHDHIIFKKKNCSLKIKKKKIQKRSNHLLYKQIYKQNL